MMEVLTMDPCRRIWFITPAGCVARFLAIVAVFVFIIVSLIAF